MDIEFLEVPQEIPWDMPILDKWLRGLGDNKPLAGATALFIQHQFGNQVPQTQAMLDLGLDPQNLFWLDVPYSSNAQVREELVNKGIPRRNLYVSYDYGLLDAYAPYQRRRVQAIIRDLLIDPPQKLLVLDDGSYFLEAASCFKNRLPNVAVIEQTSRGMIKLESNAGMRWYSQTVPIIDVARSTPKRTLEPPYIGRAVCAALFRKLEGRMKFKESRCLILGLGAIGSQVAHFVSDLGFKRKHIHVYDTDKKLLNDTIKREGFSNWDKEDLNIRFNLVIGCSGRASFTVYDHIYLEDEAVLASASSGSVELSRKDFIEFANSSKIDDIKILHKEIDEDDIHSDLRLQIVDRKITFLNGGFPVNFSGRVNCVPTQYMQPTATMMVYASVQAMKALETSKKGIFELDNKFCHWLDLEFRNWIAHNA